MVVPEVVSGSAGLPSDGRWLLVPNARYAVYSHVVQWLDARSALRSLCVCKGWARVGAGDNFLRGVYERMVAGGAVHLAGVRVGAEGSKAQWREAISTALRFEGKWGSKGHRGENNGFKINVSVRFKVRLSRAGHCTMQPGRWSWTACDHPLRLTRTAADQRRCQRRSRGARCSRSSASQALEG